MKVFGQFLSGILIVTSLSYAQKKSVDPFAVNDGLIPKKSEYDGTFNLIITIQKP